MSNSHSKSNVWSVSSVRRFCAHAQQLCARLISREADSWGGDAARYRVASEIGRGSMGTVYRVYDTMLERESAMKLCQPTAVQQSQVDQFAREACITAQLEHPGIAPVHDFGQRPCGSLFYTMKLVQGETLADILDKLIAGDPSYGQRYDRFQFLTIFRKVCDAVAFAHHRGVIHRDIKPQNIMVGQYGEVFVMDWGLAKHCEELATDSAPATRPQEPRSCLQTLNGALTGTPAFMAPEQTRGNSGEVDVRTDIFLLGATLYNLLILSPPYSGEKVSQVILQAARCQFKDPATKCDTDPLPEELRRILLRAMAARKEDRYPSVEKLAADVDDFLAGRGHRQRVLLQAGELLMRAGETGREGYIVQSGQLEVFREAQGRPVRLGILGPGDVVGEMAMLTDETRSASVRALVTSEVEKVTPEAIQCELNRLGPWMGKVVNSLAERLRQANAQLPSLGEGDDLSNGGT